MDDRYNIQNPQDDNGDNEVTENSSEEEITSDNDEEEEEEDNNEDEEDNNEEEEYPYDEDYDYRPGDYWYHELNGFGEEEENEIEEEESRSLMIEEEEIGTFFRSTRMMIVANLLQRFDLIRGLIRLAECCSFWNITEINPHEEECIRDVVRGILVCRECGFTADVCIIADYCGSSRTGKHHEWEM